VVSESEGSSRRVGSHRVTNTVRNPSLITQERTPYHDVPPMRDPLPGKSSLENRTDEIDRKPVGRILEIDRIILRAISSLYFLEKGPLIKGHILRNPPKDPEQKEMNRSKDCLGPIVQDSHRPGFLFVRDTDNLPDLVLLSPVNREERSEREEVPPKNPHIFFEGLTTKESNGGHERLRKSLEVSQRRPHGRTIWTCLGGEVILRSNGALEILDTCRAAKPQFFPEPPDIFYSTIVRESIKFPHDWLDVQVGWID
jgi:hypothetical protein